MWEQYLNLENLVNKSYKVGLVSEPKAMIQAHCNLSKCFTHLSLGCNECIDNLVNDHYLDSNRNWYVPFIRIELNSSGELEKVYLSSTKEKELWLKKQKRILKGNTFGQIAELSSSLYACPDPKNEFFYTSSKEFFEGIIQFLLSLYFQKPSIINKKNFNLKAIRKFVSNKTEPFEIIKKHSYDVYQLVEQLQKIESEYNLYEKNDMTKINDDFLIEDDWKTRLSDVSITF